MKNALNVAADLAALCFVFWAMLISFREHYLAISLTTVLEAWQCFPLLGVGDGRPFIDVLAPFICDLLQSIQNL